MHAENEKSDDSKDFFNEELEQVFDQMPNVPYEKFLWDFNVKVGEREYFQTDKLGM